MTVIDALSRSEKLEFSRLKQAFLLALISLKLFGITESLQALIEA
jgi:hypothetical protein